jgi:PII-like signaling protein
MKLEGQGTLLRVFIGESDRHEHRSLAESVVQSARDKGLAGATVVRGIEGYGANSRLIHTAKILRLSEDLPLVIELVDTDEKIRAFLPVIEGLIEHSKSGALVTLETVEIIRYAPSPQK